MLIILDDPPCYACLITTYYVRTYYFVVRSKCFYAHRYIFSYGDVNARVDELVGLRGTQAKGVPVLSCITLDVG